MSKIVNAPSGYKVASTDYSGNLAQDVYGRFQVEANELPVIYTGLQVTAASGLSVTVSAGTARGQNITVNDTPPVTNLPSFVSINTPTTITVPANSTGYIILQVNAVESGTGNQTWDVEVSSQGVTNDLLPVFVASLPSPGVDTYPFAYINLAKVITGVGSITSISMAPYLGNRSFDYRFFYNPIIVNNYPTGAAVSYILYSNGVIEFSGQANVSGSTQSISLPFPLTSIIAQTGCQVGGNDSNFGVGNIPNTFPLSSIELRGPCQSISWWVKGIAGIGSY